MYYQIERGARRTERLLMSDTRKAQPAPPQLVQDGQVNFGVFDAPLRSLNLLDYDPFPFSNAPEWLKKIRLKQWQFFLIVHPQYAFGMVIFDMGFSANSFFYIFDRSTHKLVGHKRIKMDRNVAIAENLWDGHCWFRDKNYNIEIHNHLDQGKHEIDVDIQAKGDAPAVQAQVTAQQMPGGTHPLVVSLPVRARRQMYSHKVVCAASGSVRVGDDEVVLDPTRDVAIQDEHKAFYPRHTYWKWATFGFPAGSGRTVGVNLTDNLIKDQARWNENAILTSTGNTYLGPARFNMDRHDIMKPWIIRDEDGLVDLTFTPQGAKLDRTNMGLLRVDYRQPLGLFNGTLTEGDGNVIKVRDVFGVSEYFDAWY